jgi:hypothetical protein
VPKSEPKVTEVTISHTAGGSVSIRKYDEKSSYSYFESQKFVFQEDWTPDDIAAYVEEKRQILRERVDTIGSAEHEERFSQSFMAGT